LLRQLGFSPPDGSFEAIQAALESSLAAALLSPTAQQLMAPAAQNRHSVEALISPKSDGYGQ